MKEVEVKDIDEQVEAAPRKENITPELLQELKGKKDVESIKKMPAPFTTAHADRAMELMGFVVMDQEYKAKMSEYTRRVQEKKEVRNGKEETVSMGNAFGKAGFHSTGGNRQIAIFVSWLASEKNFSFEKAARMMPGEEGFDELLSEFHKFLEAHPVDNVSDQVAKENTKEWARIFKKSQEKLGEFRFPDIDYKDPAKIKENAFLLSRLKALSIDLSQEFSLLGSNGKRAVWISEAYGGDDKVAEGVSYVNALHSITSTYETAYDAASYHRELIANPDALNERFYNKLAGERLKFGYEKAANIGGKSLKEIVNQSKVADLYKALLVAAKMPKLAENEAYQYLTGKKPIAQDKIDEYLLKGNESARKSYNTGSIFSGASDLRSRFLSLNDEANGKSDKGLIDSAFLNKGAKQTADFLKSEDPAAVALKNNSNSVFDRMLTNLNNMDFIKAAGYENALDIIKVNGKTPTQLWGEKYSFVKDPAEKDALFKAELYREMVKGKSDVVCDVLIIDANNKIVKSGSYKLAKSPATIEKEAAYIKGVQRLHEKFMAMAEELKATQNDKNANFTEGANPEGSDSYRAMTASLKELIRITDVSNEKSAEDMEGLNTKIGIFEKACQEYSNKHSGLFYGAFRAIKEKGQKRLKFSNKYKKGAGLKEDRRILNDLSKGLGYTVSLNKEMDHEVFHPHFSTTWKDLKTESQMKGIAITDEALTNRHEGIDKHVDAAVGRNDMMNRLSEVASGNMTKDELKTEHLSYLDSMFEEDRTKIARRIVKKKYEEKIRLSGRKSYSDSVEDMQEYMESDFFEKDFHEEVEKILNDKTFEKLYRKNPRTCMDAYMKQMEAAENSYFEILENTDETYQALMKEDPKNCRERWNVGHDRLQRWTLEFERDKERQNELINDAMQNPNLFNNVDVNGHKYAVDQFYTKLSHLLTMRIVKEKVDKGGESAGIKIAIHPDQMEEMQGYIINGLKNNDFLANKNTAVANLMSDSLLKNMAEGFVKDGLVKKSQAEAKAMNANKNVIQKMADDINKRIDAQKNQQAGNNEAKKTEVKKGFNK